MLKFDKLRLMTSIHFITNLNHDKFQLIQKPNGVIIYKYAQDHPFGLLILVNCYNENLVIEFTGKILKEEYPALISRNNIVKCLENINNLDICTLDIESILQYAKVLRCDITKDIQFTTHSMKSIKQHVKASITNYDKWLVKKCKNNGLVLYNSVTTPKSQKRMILYEKNKELERNENYDFLNSLSNKDEVLSYFEDKLRFEINLTTMSQIRDILHINDNKLQSVLFSAANPILEIFDKAITEIPTNIPRLNIYNKTEKLALLEQCGFDLQAVEMRIRATTPKNSSIKRKMEPYRQLLREIKKFDVGTINLRSLLA